MRGLLRCTAVLAGVLTLALSPGTPTADASTPSQALAFTPPEQDFGQVMVGHHASRAFWLANTSESAIGSLTVAVKGSADFTVTFTTCGESLGPGRRCLIVVRFAPASAGPISGRLTADGGQPAEGAAARLTGTGIVRTCSGPANGTGKPPAGTRLYWADGDRGTIMAASLDGDDPTTLVTGQEDPVGVAADSRHIYWADYGGELICEANPDGSDATEIASAVPSAAGVAVDTSHAYWTENLSFGSIRAASLDKPGETAHTLVYPQHFPYAMAVDSRHIYWTNVFDGTLMRANLDGSDVTELVSRDAGGGVAVSDSHLYWTDSLDPGGAIMRSDLDGGDVTTLVKDQPGPLGIAVHGRHLYWTNTNSGTATRAGAADGTIRQANGTGGTIMRANLNGSDVTTLLAGQARPTGIAVGPRAAPTPAPPVPVTG